MQTSYGDPQVGRPGLVQWKGYATSLVNKEATAAIPWGRMVQYASGGAKVLTATGQKFAGILVHEHDYDRTLGLDATLDGPLPNQVMSLLLLGCVEVQVEEAVTAFDPVFVRHTANGGLNRIGGFRKSANTGCDALGEAAIFVTDGDIDKTAWVFISLVKQPQGDVLTANIGDGQVTAAKLEDALQQSVGGAPGFTVGAEAADAILVSTQFKDANGDNMASVVGALCWLADTDVATPGTAADSIVVTTGTSIHVLTTALKLHAVSDAAGLLALTVTKTGAATRYLNVLTPSGRLYRSPVLTFAA